MPARRFTDEQEREIASQYPAKSTCQLAKIYGADAGTIGAIINRQGGEIRSQSEAQRIFTDEQEVEIASQYPEKNTNELAKIYNVCDLTIRSAVKRQGGKLKSSAEAGRKFTDEQEQEICQRYLAGEGTTELGKVFGVWRSTIRKLLNRNGVKTSSRRSSNKETKSPKRAKRKLTDEQEQGLCQRYLAGENTPKLAKSFGIGDTTVLRILERNKVKRRSLIESAGGLSPEQDVEVCRRYQQGERAVELASAFGVDNTTICMVLRRNGIERRASGVEFGDSVQHIFDGTGHHQSQRECELYLFELARYSATHCKPGIAFDTDVRAGISNGEYGEEVLRLFFASRAEAYFLEQAVLDATRGSAQCPADLNDWIGHTEVRAMPAADMVPTILRLAEELEELGQWEFASLRCPMTMAQRVICQQRAMVEVAK